MGEHIRPEERRARAVCWGRIDDGIVEKVIPEKTSLGRLGIAAWGDGNGKDELSASKPLL